MLHMCAHASLHRVELFPSRHICASVSVFCLLVLTNRPRTRNDHNEKNSFFLRRDAMHIYDHWLYGVQCSVFCWCKGQRAPQKPSRSSKPSIRFSLQKKTPLRARKKADTLYFFHVRTYVCMMELLYSSGTVYNIIHGAAQKQLQTGGRWGDSEQLRLGLRRMH